MPRNTRSTRSTLSKEEKEQKNIQNQMRNVSSNSIELSNARSSAVYFMRCGIMDDIQYRRENNMGDILSKKETDKLFAELQVNWQSREPIPADDIVCLYNIGLINRAKSKEIEIKDGHLCKTCGKNSAIMRNYQFRAGDEGTGRALQCTNPNCKVMTKLDAG